MYILCGWCSCLLQRVGVTQPRARCSFVVTQLPANSNVKLAKCDKIECRKVSSLPYSENSPFMATSFYDASHHASFAQCMQPD